MAKRRIVWTKTASRQRRIVLAYWVNRNKSKSYSLKLLQASNKKAELIAKSPELFKHADFPNTHVATMVHYSMFYQFNAKEVVIIAFWDNRQNPAKLLKSLRSNQQLAISN